MKRILFVAFAAVLLCGCATMTASTFTSANRENLVRLSTGITRAQALDIMGVKNCEYNCDMSTAKQTLKVKLNNPYRTEIVEVSGKKLEVLYYLIELNNANCTVNDDELTPLVFEDAKLIGWGNNFLSGIMAAASEKKSAPVAVTQ